MLLRHDASQPFFGVLVSNVRERQALLPSLLGLARLSLPPPLCILPPAHTERRVAPVSRQHLFRFQHLLRFRGLTRTGKTPGLLGVRRRRDTYCLPACEVDTAVGMLLVNAWVHGVRLLRNAAALAACQHHHHAPQLCMPVS